ncbi:RNA polymerase sigma-70 factor [Bacteroides sp.]|uniref:RNA polymerase sigma-70 factor n=1 Tax=Bacteroides sp. TaxID=29523 RepID=UPI00263087E1|nr:RNA polymerase sigma-70 factor [Bacteroides sp.]
MLEEVAIHKLKDGDESAFEYLYRSLWTKVYDFTRLYITSTADAEEIVHEVFVKLWDVRTFIDENKNFEGLLFIMTRNIIFNKFRKSFNEDFYKMTLVEAVEESYSIEEELEASDLLEYVRFLITQLPPRAQEVFRLSREQHLTYKEIAELLSISEKVVEHHISDTLKFLRSRIELYLFFTIVLGIKPPLE